MRVPNPTKLLPSPSYVFALGRRLAGLLPHLPGRSDTPEAEPAEPSPPPPPKPKAKAAKPAPADPHHALNNPVGEPDPTAWPDPYAEDGDRLDPHPAQDPDTQAATEKLKREKLDD